VVASSIIGYVFASLAVIYLFPMGNYAMAKLLFEVARVNTSIGIKQGAFNDSIPDVVLSANHISAYGQTMEGVFIFDEGDPTLSNTIIARRGKVSSNPEQMSINLRSER
jgi:lipopolysaccharide export LptBFGC system permease protein LptF